MEELGLVVFGARVVSATLAWMSNLLFVVVLSALRSITDC